MFPKLISIGRFYLPSYGVLVALGFLLGLWMTVRLARRAGLPVEKITNLAVYCALAGLLGAKLLMFVFDFQRYAANPGEIFSVDTLQTAGVYQGGLVLAIITAFLYVRRQKLPGFMTSDVFAPGLALGHAIGRVGCLAAGCCWGVTCNRPWAITFTNDDAHQLVGVPLGMLLHPTQIYESVANLALFGILLWRIRRPHAPGAIIGLYLILYSVLRFVIEFWRFHEQGLHAGLSLTQWIAVALFAAGVIVLAYTRRAPTAAAA